MVQDPPPGAAAGVGADRHRRAGRTDRRLARGPGVGRAPQVGVTAQPRPGRQPSCFGRRASTRPCTTCLSYGHPLGLALLADLVRRGDPLDAVVLPPDFVEALLRRFLETVPDPTQRRALAAAAVARCTTEVLLRAVIDAKDAHEVFTWLWQLSFVEPRPDGLALHDLARDVLDADLRWRDEATYRQVFDQVRLHSLAALRDTTGRAQQRAIVDLKFLFRRVRPGCRRSSWTPGASTTRNALALRTAATSLIWFATGRGGVGRDRESWLDRQPRGFFVVRHHDGSVRVLVMVNLTQASVDEIDADPGTRAAWQFAHRHGPPRPGEALTQCRFVVDRQSYQGPSPTLNATPILTLQEQALRRTCPGTSSPWPNPISGRVLRRAADLPRAEGADFSVGDHLYGLFAHDFRSVRLMRSPGCGPRRPWPTTRTWPRRSTYRRTCCSPFRTSRRRSGRLSRICSDPTCSLATL